MQRDTPRIEEAHRRYCELTGYRLLLSIDRHYWWAQWLAKGFTDADLALVVRNIQKGIKTGNRHQGALKWSHLIQEPDRFEEELMEARASLRNTPPLPSVKDRWVQKPVDTARHVSKLMPDISALVKAAHEACERKEA